MDSFLVSESHKCFDGHFNDKKIFPAVAQISICKEAIEGDVKDRRVVFRAAKFMRPVAPGTRLYLHRRNKGDCVLVDVKTDLYLYSRIEFALED